MIVNFESEVARRKNIQHDKSTQRCADSPFPNQSSQRVLSSLPPRGLSHTEAARYIGVSASLFDEMVKDGRMPGPKRINSRTVWDRKRLDDAFEVLPDNDSGNPWDEDEAA